jgi:addiction module RelE/StbE family toxin
MWEILEHKRVDKVLQFVPMEILQRYEKWKDIVSISGPDGLKHIKGFKDEALKGNWKGYRASRLNIQYRVLYKIIVNKVLVQVENITAHDYRRKK